MLLQCYILALTDLLFMNRSCSNSDCELLCAGLLRFLCEVVDSLPDNMVLATLTKIVRPEVFIVLAQNQSETIRVAVVKVRP